jgi:hypothetical protein
MDAEEVAELDQLFAYHALRDEVRKENAMRVEVLDSMLRRRLKRIVRDCRECLAVISCLDSQFDCEPIDLTPLLTVSRDAEQVLADLNARLAHNSPH